MNSKIQLSIVVPCFNEAMNIPLLLEKFNDVIHTNHIQVVLVNNGSHDDSYEVLKISTLFIIFSLIIIETTCTLFVRICRKEDFFSGRHDLHAYQQLAKQPNNGALPAKISIVLTILWIVPMGFFSHIFEGKETIIVLLSSFPLFLLSYFYGPYKTIKDNIF